MTCRILAILFSVEGTWRSRQHHNLRKTAFKPTPGSLTHSLTNKASLSTIVLIFVQSSSQQMFSSAVATKAEQQANTLYSLDHEESMAFRVA